MTNYFCHDEFKIFLSLNTSKYISASNILGYIRSLDYFQESLKYRWDQIATENFVSLSIIASFWGYKFGLVQPCSQRASFLCTYYEYQ